MVGGGRGVGGGGTFAQREKSRKPILLTPARVLVALRAAVRVADRDVGHILLVLMERLRAVRADRPVRLARELLALGPLRSRHVAGRNTRNRQR